MIRRAIGTTLACLCAVSGPLAGSSFAAAPTLSTDVASARPGVPFTLTPSVDCPSADGAQSVQVSYEDRNGTVFVIGTIDTTDDGSWDPTAFELPVAGLDTDGNWDATPVAAGAGTLSAECLGTSDEPDDPDGGEDAGDGGGDISGQSADDGHGGSADPGDDGSGDTDGSGSDGDATVTMTYPGIAFTSVGAAAKILVSAASAKPGGSVTVTPAEGCTAGGVSTVDVALTPVGPPPGEEDGGDSGDVTGSTTTTSTGGWSPLTLALPTDVAVGDYAVTATCTADDGSTSDYDAQPVAIGTVVISAAACGVKSTLASMSGTYDATITTGKRALTLPAKLVLAGDGPWKVQARSAATGLLLASRTLSCDGPRYALDVPRTGLSDSGKVRARACNTGRWPLTAVLQVADGKRYAPADKEALDPGDCTWLTGPRLDKGEKAKARVLLDAPGVSADDVVATFTAKRPRR